MYLEQKVEALENANVQLDLEVTALREQMRQATEEINDLKQAVRDLTSVRWALFDGQSWLRQRLDNHRRTGHRK